MSREWKRASPWPGPPLARRLAIDQNDRGRWRRAEPAADFEGSRYPPTLATAGRPHAESNDVENTHGLVRQPGMFQEPGRLRADARAAGPGRLRDRARCAAVGPGRRQHLRVHRRGAAGVDRRDRGAAGAEAAGARQGCDRRRLPGRAAEGRAAGAVPRGRPRRRRLRPRGDRPGGRPAAGRPATSSARSSARRRSRRRTTAPGCGSPRGTSPI